MMSTRIGSLVSALAGTLLVLLWASSAHEAFKSFDELCPPCVGEQLELFNKFYNLELEDVKKMLDEYREKNPKVGDMQVSDILEYENIACDLTNSSFVHNANVCCGSKYDTSLYDPEMSSVDFDVSSTDFNMDELGVQEIRLNPGLALFLNDQLAKRVKSCIDELHPLLEEALKALTDEDRKLLEQYDARRPISVDQLRHVALSRRKKFFDEGNTSSLLAACSKFEEIMTELESTIDPNYLEELQADTLIMEWWNIKRLCMFNHTFKYLLEHYEVLWQKPDQS